MVVKTGLPLPGATHRENGRNSRQFRSNRLQTERPGVDRAVQMPEGVMC